MNKDLIEVNLEGKGLGELLCEIQQAFEPIPMGNTRFQIENFILNAAITPERKYRAIGMELNSKLKELRNTRISVEKIKIDIEEIEFKISKSQDLFEKRRLKLDLNVKKYELESFNKTVIDSIEEVKIYYAHFKKMPQISREDFEKSEEAYYMTHLHGQVIGLTGALGSLYQMGYVVNPKNGELELASGFIKNK